MVTLITATTDPTVLATLNTSGATYTIPYDGWFMLSFYNDGAFKLNNHIGIGGMAGNRQILPLKTGTVVSWMQGTVHILDCK
jgi:hypothetical protein